MGRCLILAVLCLLCINQCCVKGASLETLRTEMTSYVNNLRARKELNPLRLDDQTNKEAQEWAEHLAIINRLEVKTGYFEMEHRKVGPYESLDDLLLAWNDTTYRDYWLVDWMVKIGLGIAHDEDNVYSAVLFMNN